MTGRAAFPRMRAAHLAPSAFTTEAPNVTACFTDDGVHFSDLGYTIWSARLARML